MDFPTGTVFHQHRANCVISMSPTMAWSALWLSNYRVEEVHLSINAERALKGRSSRAHPSMLHPLPRLPRPRPSARRTMAAPRHYSQPSRIRLNNVLPRPAFTTRGAWLSSENTSPLLHKRKEAALPERKPACCASPCLGILSINMCARVYRVSPPATMFGFYRRALWVQGCGLCVNSTAARLLCGEGEVFRLDSNRGHFMC